MREIAFASQQAEQSSSVFARHHGPICGVRPRESDAPTRSLEIQYSPSDRRFVIAVIDTTAHHTLGRVNYNPREECEKGLDLRHHLPGITALRDLTPDHLEKLELFFSSRSNPLRHVVWRTSALFRGSGVHALDYVTAGELCRAHDLRDAYEYRGRWIFSVRPPASSGVYGADDGWRIAAYSEPARRVGS